MMDENFNQLKVDYEKLKKKQIIAQQQFIKKKIKLMYR